MSAQETRDPKPWVHMESGSRVSDPHASDLVGGFTYYPRAGYSDYPDRYVSTRFGDILARADWIRDET